MEGSEKDEIMKNVRTRRNVKNNLKAPMVSSLKIKKGVRTRNNVEKDIKTPNGSNLKEEEEKIDSMVLSPDVYQEILTEIKVEDTGTPTISPFLNAGLSPTETLVPSEDFITPVEDVKSVCVSKNYAKSARKFVVSSGYSITLPSEDEIARSAICSAESARNR